MIVSRRLADVSINNYSSLQFLNRQAKLKIEHRHIQDQAYALTQQFHSSTPSELAGHLGLKVDLQPMPDTIYGYYVSLYDTHYAVINSSLSDELKDSTIAYSVAHHVYEKGQDEVFLKTNIDRRYGMKAVFSSSILKCFMQTKF
ncbi:hypothetical protein [Paenibacillus oleatilyticus]|uniref:hypothetical protein n=1 Tax=Paenibacillus oleatilyticus TaxID=2594886 RepID=UPI001C1F4853|nr:hypothetical protein [Paenibacillus oleatilyticus]MBU7316229.1 hypothetical protein [Paenibacillus oleatilyticus]